MEKRYHVLCRVGQSRNGEYLCNWASCPLENGEELYAESESYDRVAEKYGIRPEELKAWCEMTNESPYFLEQHTIPLLRAEIERQAAAHGLAPEEFDFSEITPPEEPYDIPWEEIDEAFEQA